VIEVVALASTFTNTGKHRVAAVLFSDVVDQLHQRHGLADTGTTEQANLAALGYRHNQVDNLDTGLEQLRCRCLLFIRRRRPMNRHFFLGTNFAGVIDRPAKHIHDASQRFLSNRDRNGGAGIGNGHAALQTLRRTHRDRANNAIAQLLLNFERNVRVVNN